MKRLLGVGFFLFPLLLGALLLAPAALAASEAWIHLKVRTFRNLQGNLMVAVYSDARAFPDRAEGAARLAQAKVTGTTMEVDLKGLSAGPYAISLFHDENGNGKLDKGSFGIPLEGFGFSRNPPVQFAAPTFEDAKVELAPGVNELEIQLTYM